MKSAAFRFVHIKESIEHIELFLSQDPSLDELRTAQAIHYELMVIGEAVRCVPEEFMQRFGDIPWRKMVALRHILTHEYFNVQRDRIVAAVDLPRIKQRIEAIITDIQ